jgi:hypothetical protein
VGPLVLKDVKGPAVQMLNDHVVSLMYAQSVMFWYFCKHHENGKYWPCLLQYLKWEWGLAGETPPSPRTLDPAIQEQYLGAFRMAFGKYEVEAVDREFWQFVDQMARTHCGRGIPAPPLPK